MQETQASRLIRISARTGGISESRDEGRPAFLVPPNDSEALAGEIAWVLDHPEKWAEWQHAGRAWVEQQFSSEKLGDRLWELYAEAPVLAGHPSAPPVRAAGY